MAYHHIHHHIHHTHYSNLSSPASPGSPVWIAAHNNIRRQQHKTDTVVVDSANHVKTCITHTYHLPSINEQTISNVIGGLAILWVIVIAVVVIKRLTKSNNNER